MEVYFTVVTKLSIKDLVKNDIKELKDKKMQIKVKRTKDEHTKKVGFLSGTIISKVNIEQYEKTLFTLAKLDKGKAELRKETIYEGDIKSKCITIHSIESKAAKVNFNLQKLSSEERFHIKYVSFKNNNSHERILGL